MSGDPAKESDARVVLVSGAEDLLVDRALGELRAAVSARDPDAEISEVDGAALDVGGFRALVSPSLFGGARLVVVRPAVPPAATTDAVLAYVADPDPDVTLVLVHDGGARGKKFADAVRKAGATVIDCPRITRADERLDFVRNEFRRAGGRIDAAGARALVDAVGSDLRELAGAVNQLVSDAGLAVDETVVRRYYSGRAEAKGWAVADRALEGRLSLALEELRWVMDVGTEPVLVIGSLASGIRNLAAVASRGNASEAAIAKASGLPAWKVRNIRRQSAGWTPDGVAAALRAVADADVEVKGGGAHPAYALERAVRRICEARGAGRR